MNRKYRYLMIIPFYGTVIILFIFYFKSLFGKINLKVFRKLFFLCGFFGAFSIFISILFLKIIGIIFSTEAFMNNYGIYFAFVLGGYLMNIFTYKVLNKNFDKLVILKD
ncbi:MAG: hypothetical protein ACOCV1_04585 [Bacillota bacterium]